MEKPNQTTPHLKAFELLSGMFTTQILAAMQKFNVLETIGLGSKTPDEIVVSCNVNKNVLCRTLRYLEFMGIMNREEQKYSLTGTGKFFLKDTPGNLSGSLSFVSAPPWRDSWNNFSHCLQTGEPAFDNVFHKPFFNYLDEHQEYGKPFNHYQTMLSSMIAPAVAESYDFSCFKTICDVGGGEGILLKSVLEKFPSCKGILFDMENALANHVLGETKNRVQMVPGNFFESVPPADCMMLKTIIHDWNDERSNCILTNCRKSLNTGGKILLIEQVIEQPFTQTGLFYDLHMQVMLGGAERTESEFANLLKESGLKLNRIISTKSPMKIIEISVAA